MPRHYSKGYAAATRIQRADGPPPDADQAGPGANAPPPPPPPLDEGPQKPKSDFTYKSWDKFLCQLPKRRSELAKQIDDQKAEVEQTPGDGLQIQENAFASWEQAANNCRAKVAAIVKECKRLNQRYRDTTFDLELDDFCVKSLDGNYPKGLPVDPDDVPPQFVKRVADVFDKPEFFIDGAEASDVHQGMSGDCWFLASLMALSAMKKELIEERLCVARDEMVDVYGFVFFRDGEWIYEVIDGRVFVKLGDNENLTLIKNWKPETKDGFYVPFSQDRYDQLKEQLQRGGEALYFSHCKSSETWLPLIEKAYAKAHGDYYSIEGGFTSEGIEDLTGGVGVFLNSDEIMDKERFWKEQLSQVNVKYLWGGSTMSTSKGILAGHAYAVLQAWEDPDSSLRLLKIRNPWGNCEWEGDWSDGSKLWTPDMLRKVGHTFGDDGIFWMSYADFLKRFTDLNRVRLFSEDWHVSQCWTSVNVPWAVDYLDTKFVFTITEKCSVVIVLSQPDDRYYWALRGRYFYALHFQVFKQDDSNGHYIVRSKHSSGAEPQYTRSVSAEIEDLEPGTYNVVFKVTAERRADATTAEETILKYAKQRKEKLLSVGRRFDYAQSKGNLRAMEQANRKAVVQEVREYNSAMQQRDRKYDMLKNEQARKKKKRINDAMKAKREEMKRKKEASAEKNDAPKAEEPVENAATDDEEKSESKDGVTPSTTTEDSPMAQTLKSSEDEPVSEGAVEGAAEEKTSEVAAIPADVAASPVNDEADRKEDEPKDKADAKEDEPKDKADAKEDEPTDKSGAKEAEPKDDSDTKDTEPKENEPFVSVAKGDYRPQADYDGAELARQFDQLDLQDYPPGGDRGPAMGMPPPGGGDSDSEEPIDPLEDEDFEWDPELDDDVYLSTDDEDAPVRRFNLSANNEIFEGDPWNAMCVLGLRVYSEKATSCVEVVKGENSS